MRLSFALVLLLPSLAHAQLTAEQKKQTANWVLALQAPGGGFYAAPNDPTSETKPVPSLRATNAAVKALKYLGATELPHKPKHAAFVLTCFDPKTGGFAEPGGKPDVTTTAIGVMAAAELDIPHAKYRKAMDYLKENAKTFEEVRIGAAAVEAWGVKDCPFKLDEWRQVASRYSKDIKDDPKDGGARNLGSVSALFLRLGWDFQPSARAEIIEHLRGGQRDDGGWGQKGAKSSDIGTTYRVMRAYHLLKEKPKDVKKLREFIAARRNKDGGYGTEPGGKSTVNGVYYAAIISHWLDALEKK
jgi:prenyltransferase beta subunit